MIKKNILLGVMTILALIFFVFGYIQKIEADRQTELALTLKQEAETQRVEAEKMRLMAEYHQMEAEKQKASVLEALAACEKSKRK